jgi:hypothetical protein
MLLSSAESPLMASCQHRLVPTRHPTFKHVLSVRVIGQFVSSAPSERRFSFVCGCEIELPSTPINDSSPEVCFNHAPD